MKSLFVVVLSFLALAAQDLKPGSAKPFQAGDTVCYVGDSITHGGTYHALVTLFYTPLAFRKRRSSTTTPASAATAPPVSCPMNAIA